MRKLVFLSIIIYFLFPFTSALRASEVVTKSVSNNLLAQRKRGSLRTNSSSNSNGRWINRGRRSGQLNQIIRREQRQIFQNTGNRGQRDISPTDNDLNTDRKTVISPDNNRNVNRQRQEIISPTNSGNRIRERKRTISPNYRNTTNNRQRIVYPNNNNIRRSYPRRNGYVNRNNRLEQKVISPHRRRSIHRNIGTRRSINPNINRRDGRYIAPNSNYTRKKINRNRGYRRIDYPYISRKSNWRWYGGRRWYPNRKYWGGGFWGSFIISPTVRVIRQQTNTYDSYRKYTNYQTIEANAPGYELFKNYKLTQVRCDVNQNLVFVYGPADTLMCAIPNENVPAGQYYIDLEDLILVVRD